MIDLKENLLARHLVFDEKNKSHKNIEELRQHAIEVFKEKGFPKRKDEEWKYTNIAPILKVDYKLFPETEVGLEYKDIKKYLINDIDTYLIVFINGKYSSFLSNTTHDEADICVLSSALNNSVHHSVIENYFGKIAAKDESFTALNTAFARDGAFIYVPNNTILSKPIQVVYFSTGVSQEVMYQPRNLIVIGDNAQAQIIECHQTLDGVANLTNAVTEVNVGKNAEVQIHKFQNDSDNVSLIDNVYINQERDSRASVFTFAFGGKIVRNNLNFYQNGENCNSILDGVTIIDKKQHVDHHTLVVHNYPNCESHELYKGIYADEAHGVFNGKIYVHKEAQKLNAFQQNNNVLLSDSASIDTKPQLEIFADDVKCSHGCTVGQLDEDAMFYMQQRGIGKEVAQALLLYAFAADALQHVTIPQVTAKVNQLVANKLGVSIDFDL
ncbi:Fe-S cluster assembly protein SufD [Weeksella virosa]|uniref:Fe-S cluster assembly protein SufD n=1 Tax=Weeksella virosa TaxID=1014 RepID=UPI000E026913|nr:Fe-S cluster assembly protein SufD [Weeksella virosa]MDK7674995.1 Fe-S cluster assembly protein SufD [Weeksella virosa]SUP53337.1 FeS cluster assembly protein sufD [Weeksella virosa]